MSSLFAVQSEAEAFLLLQVSMMLNFSADTRKNSLNQA
jgi:hypothetical protein